MSSGINPSRRQRLLPPLRRGPISAVMPPSMTSPAPVMKAASSEARNTMPLAISSGVPMRPVLDPGRGRTKTGRLWSYARDDRPWQGSLPPAVAYVYSENRQGVHPRSHLAEFTGVLQVDGYTGFNRLSGERPAGSVELAFCRVGGDVAIPAPHRPGRADYPHPVL